MVHGVRHVKLWAGRLERLKKMIDISQFDYKRLKLNMVLHFTASNFQKRWIKITPRVMATPLSILISILI